LEIKCQTVSDIVSTPFSESRRLRVLSHRNSNKLKQHRKQFTSKKQANMLINF
jgi:hypothetical protein